MNSTNNSVTEKPQNKDDVLAETWETARGEGHKPSHPLAASRVPAASASKVRWAEINVQSRTTTPKGENRTQLIRLV